MQEIGRRMLEICDENRGYGLSGNQVGLKERIFVMREPETKLGIIFVNPEVTTDFSHSNLDYEGCLSLPMQRVKIKRFSNLKIEYDDPNGYGRITQEFSGMNARCIQHEMDHLDGILLMDHINSNLGLKSFLEKYAKDMKQARRKGLYL